MNIAIDSRSRKLVGKALLYLSTAVAVGLASKGILPGAATWYALGSALAFAVGTLAGLGRKQHAFDEDRSSSSDELSGVFWSFFWIGIFFATACVANG